MPTLPLDLDQLADCLRANAAGYYPSEAATELLIGHGSWLRRDDFLTTCVDYDHDGTTPVAWIVWAAIPAFLAVAPCSSSEASILRLVAELEGEDTGRPLVDLLTGLDDANSRLVLAAIAHTLQVSRGARR
jgi:hypothetical protein